MKLPLYSSLVLLLAWILRAIRMIGDRDYEHLKFHLWFDADLKARGMRVVNVTKREDFGKISHGEFIGQLEELQREASR